MLLKRSKLMLTELKFLQKLQNIKEIIMIVYNTKWKVCECETNSCCHLHLAIWRLFTKWNELCRRCHNHCHVYAAAYENFSIWKLSIWCLDYYIRLFELIDNFLIVVLPFFIYIDYYMMIRFWSLLNDALPARCYQRVCKYDIRKIYANKYL